MIGNRCADLEFKRDSQPIRNMQVLMVLAFLSIFVMKTEANPFCNVIALKCDNGKYMSVIYRSLHGSMGYQVECQKSNIDSWSKFRVYDTSNDAVQLQAINTKKFLGRVYYGSVVQPIMANKPQTDRPFNVFKVTKYADGKISLRADNGLYLSRINRNDVDPVEALKKTADYFSRFHYQCF